MNLFFLSSSATSDDTFVCMKHVHACLDRSASECAAGALAKSWPKCARRCFFLTPHPPNAALAGLLTLLLGFVFVRLFSLRFAAAGAFRVLVFVVSAASVNRPPPQPCALFPVGSALRKTVARAVGHLHGTVTNMGTLELATRIDAKVGQHNLLPGRQLRES